jgi:hypothetical protein
MKSTTIRFILFVLVGLFVSAAGQQIAHAQQGDLTTVDDPLNGKYELYTVDDLVIQGPTVDATQSTIVNYLLDTENNAVTTQATDHALTINCTVTDGPAQHTRVGRFFAIDRDVLVTLHPNVNASARIAVTRRTSATTWGFALNEWGKQILSAHASSCPRTRRLW